MPPWIPPAGYARRPTREVAVGGVRIGGQQPIRVQSMTTPPPGDVAGTVEQAARLAAAGCEIIRLTIPTPSDADHIPAIRSALERRGVRVPLVADIHFSPAAALRAVEHVEKVRINPGNFADSKRFAQREYSDAEYARQIDRLEEKLRPLVLRARELGVAMRIGTNHGSLSDRIMNRYGDTPLGMVESALEFVRICESHGYRDLVVSMKASNPQVTLQAYRLLAVRMAEAGMDYPFHLGVTEAGDGREGRVKSSIGIGALLEEGLGDTVRVSLTEDPVEEIPVARALVAPFNSAAAENAACDRNGNGPAAWLRRPDEVITRYERRPTRRLEFERRAPGRLKLLREDPGQPEPGVQAVGGDEPVRAEIRLRASELRAHLPGLLTKERGAELVSIAAGAGGDTNLAADIAAGLLSKGVVTAWVEDGRSPQSTPCGVNPHSHLAFFQRLDLILPPETDRAIGLARSWSDITREIDLRLLLEFSVPDEPREALETPLAVLEALRSSDSAAPPPMLALLPSPGCGSVPALRRLVERLRGAAFGCPILLVEEAPEDPRHELLRPAARLGGLLCDGIGDALRVDGPQEPRRRLDLAYEILQGARVRLSKTEFISCPSCGRTLFDLESTTRRIKNRTAHLKGVKIAIMGCIVNGPGEMADADFGYVGGAPGKVNLYVGRDCVARHVDEQDADSRLVELIKEHGRWLDPPAPAAASDYSVP